MLGIHDYGLFVATGIVLNLMPGQDTFYILGNSIAHGRRIGLASALGVVAGCVVHTFAAALGLSAILATSATAFTLLKLAGAAYLVYLGVRTLLTAAPADRAPPDSDAISSALAFRRGVLSNVLNPKVALFFLALLPQFIDADSPAKVAAFIVLGLSFVATGTVWCAILAVAAARARDAFARHPRAFANLTRASGALFVFLGARLAMSER